jgi:hypothetical protein
MSREEWARTDPRLDDAPFRAFVADQTCLGEEKFEAPDLNGLSSIYALPSIASLGGANSPFRGSHKEMSMARVPAGRILWLVPQAILPGRIVKFGLQLQF